MRWWKPYTEEILTSVVLNRQGGSARMLGAIGRGYRLCWQGCNKVTAGVSVFICERWIDSVVDVVRVNERFMYVKLVIGKQIVCK